MLLTYPKIRSMQMLVVIKKKKIADNDKNTKTKIITVQFSKNSRKKIIESPYSIQCHDSIPSNFPDRCLNFAP